MSPVWLRWQHQPFSSKISTNDLWITNLELGTRVRTAVNVVSLPVVCRMPTLQLQAAVSGFVEQLCQKHVPGRNLRGQA